MLFSGCSICSRPDVGAINAALRSQSVRAVAAAFPGLSKSSIGRHAKHADEPDAILHPVSNPEAPSEPQVVRVRHRTRPAALSCATGAPGAALNAIDPETRALEALWMRQAGKSWRQIAAAFNVPESTITDDLARMRRAEIEDARRTVAEDHVADIRAANRLLAAKLIKVHDRAASRGDERAALDAIRELRQVQKQDAELLRQLGAFNGYQPGADRKAQEARNGEDLIDMMKDWAGMFAMDDTDITMEDIQRLAADEGFLHKVLGRD